MALIAETDDPGSGALLEPAFDQSERTCAPPQAIGQSRSRPRTLWFCLPLWPLFEGRPAFFFPAFDGLLLALVSLALVSSTRRLLQAQPQGFEQLAARAIAPVALG